ncbi:flagellar hook-associated protein FlgK [Parasphingorhabdus sp.]|uniref:flagellar hook-associated protein FlgK n=1 Tax=Parasphingorhabdus sp. TaxID=2709688 RepID=UPI003263F6A4
MTDLFAIGQGALKAYSHSLTTISQNISNAENPDYVRRSTRLSDATLTGLTNPLYLTSKEHSGVSIAGIARSADQFLDASLRQSGAALVRTETATMWLANIESGLGNSGQDVGQKLTQMFSRGEQLAAAPFDSALRQSFLSDISETATAFQRTAENLSQTSDFIYQSAEQSTTQLNGALSELAQTNVELRKVKEGSASHASLLDRRDTALTVISEQLDADISFGEMGMADVSYAGQSLVNVNVAATTSVSRNTDGSFNFQIDGSTVAAPSDGNIAGLSSSSQTLVQRRQSVDTQAQQFVDDVNAWQAAGETDAGGAGGPILSIGADATTIATVTQDPADLALAAPGGAANGNILALSAYRGPGQSEQNWDSLIATHANGLSAQRSEMDAATAFHNNTSQARDDVSRVDLDREAADLIRYQQAYAAAARVIQVARETTQSILSIF